MVIQPDTGIEQYLDLTRRLLPHSVGRCSQKAALRISRPAGWPDRSTSKPLETLSSESRLGDPAVRREREGGKIALERQGQRDGFFMFEFFSFLLIELGLDGEGEGA